MREDHHPLPHERQRVDLLRTPWNQRPVEDGLAHPRGSAFRDAASRAVSSRRDGSSAWPDAPETLHAGSSERTPQRRSTPRIVAYLAEDSQAYSLRDLIEGDEKQVAKQRAAPDPFPPSREQRAPGAGLLRLSGYALFGALLGGAPGAVLGALIALIALARLARFERRARLWRANAKKRDTTRRLPTAATNERLRLMTALWQSVGAAMLGGIVLALLLTALR